MRCFGEKYRDQSPGGLCEEASMSQSEIEDDIPIQEIGLAQGKFGEVCHG